MTQSSCRAEFLEMKTSVAPATDLSTEEKFLLKHQWSFSSEPAAPQQILPERHEARSRKHPVDLKGMVLAPASVPMAKVRYAASPLPKTP